MTVPNGGGWRQFVGAAADGSLVLDEGVGARCAKHCDDFIAKLRALQKQAYRLGDVKGFGTLPSGIAVARKFSLAAVGGEYSMVDALEDHITEVQAMKEVFLTIEARYEATDQDTADRIGSADSNS